MWYRGLYIWSPAGTRSTMKPSILLGSRLIPYSWAQALNVSEAQMFIKCLFSIHRMGGHTEKQEVTVRGEQTELVYAGQRREGGAQNGGEEAWPEEEAGLREGLQEEVGGARPWEHRVGG